VKVNGWVFAFVDSSNWANVTSEACAEGASINPVRTAAAHPRRRRLAARALMISIVVVISIFSCDWESELDARIGLYAWPVELIYPEWEIKAVAPADLKPRRLAQPVPEPKQHDEGHHADANGDNPKHGQPHGTILRRSQATGA
jgi:hypothetical protein